MNQLTGREFRGVDLAKDQFPGVNMLPDVESQAFCPDHESCHGLIEGEKCCTAAALDLRHGITDGNRRLSAARGSQQERARAAIEPSAKQRVERGDAAFQLCRLEAEQVLRGD